MAPAGTKSGPSMVAPTSSELRSRALALLHEGRAEQAKLVLEAALQEDQQDAQARLLLASVCLELKPPAHEEALECARQALSIASRSFRQDPTRATACSLGLAVALGSVAREGCLSEQQRQKHRSEAISVLQAAARTAAPTLQPLLQYNLAVLLAEAGSADQALKSARAALQGCSAATAATSAGGAGTTSATSAGAAVSVLEGEGLQREAGAKRQQLATLCLVLLSLLTSARHQPEAALQLLTAAQEPSDDTAVAAGGPASAALHPSAVLLARARAALLHGRMGDTAGAMSELVKHKMRVASAFAAAGADGGGGSGGGAGSATPAHVQLMTQVWQDLALLCLNGSDSSEAFFCVDQALQLDPWQARSHQTLGQAYEAAGKAEAAMDSYNTALALDPSNASTLLSLGALLRRKGTVADLAVARDLLSESLRQQPSSAAGWYQLGLACRGLGHAKEAEQHLRTAVVLAAGSPALPYAECPLLLHV